jgi:hypothetical protein
MVTPAAHREAVDYLRSTHEMSQRRACRVIGSDRATVRYEAKRSDDGYLRERLKALAAERRRLAEGRYRDGGVSRGEIWCGKVAWRHRPLTPPPAGGTGPKPT